MRLYITATGRYVGTQDDAKVDGKGWRLEEVPTTKTELIDYLNALKGKTECAEVDEDIDTSDIPEADEKWFKEAKLSEPTAEAIAAKVSQFKADEIIDFILDHADVNQAANILSALGTRFGELIKSQKGA